MGSRIDFDGLGERLAAAGLHVREARLPGHGTTPRDFARQTPESLYAGADDELRALKRQYKSVSVVGFSMGGSLATLLAERECPVLLVMSRGDRAASPRRAWAALDAIGSRRKRSDEPIMISFERSINRHTSEARRDRTMMKENVVNILDAFDRCDARCLVAGGLADAAYGMDYRLTLVLSLIVQDADREQAVRALGKLSYRIEAPNAVPADADSCALVGEDETIIIDLHWMTPEAFEREYRNAVWLAIGDRERAPFIAKDSRLRETLKIDPSADELQLRHGMRLLLGEKLRWVEEAQDLLACVKS